jgi:molybdate/tungstate transport system permease protein
LDLSAETPVKRKLTHQSSSGSFWFLFITASLSLVLLLFLFLPLAKVVFLSDKQSFFKALTDPTTISSIVLTLSASLATTAIGLLFGVPLAYLLARSQFRFKSVVETIVEIPVVVPHTAAGIALLFVFGRNFFLGKVAGLVGLSFVDSFAGIMIAMLFVSVPFLIMSAKEGFSKVDVRLEKVSRTLGASPWQSFRYVSLPLASRSILAGSLMMWARGISEFGAIVILAYYPMVTPTLIFQRFESYGLAEAIPVAALLILICGSIFVLVRVALRRVAND